MNSYRKICLASVFIILISACTHVGPKYLERDRFDYTAAVGDSWKEQILLNVVRIRYGDWPTFVSIEQIITGYQVEHTGSARLTDRDVDAPTGSYFQPELGYIGKFIEKPTVLYKPMSGDQFTKTLMTAVNPSVILAMIETGWPADNLSRISLRSVNGAFNTLSTYGSLYRPDINFTRFIGLLRSFQLANAIRVRVSQKEGEQRVTDLTFFPQLVSVELQEQYRNLQSALKLSDSTNTYRLARDSHSRQPDEISLRGRSILEIFTILASGVKVPESHKRSGITAQQVPVPKIRRSNSSLFFTVESGPVKPRSANVAVEYLDTWFWIEHSDHYSKRVIAYAQMIMSLLDNKQDAGGNVVIPID